MCVCVCVRAHVRVCVNATLSVCPFLPFPGAKWSRIRLPMEETQVQSLTWEDPPLPHPPPGVGNDDWLQYSCLGNPMDRGAWPAAVPGVTKSQSDTTEWLNDNNEIYKGLNKHFPVGTQNSLHHLPEALLVCSKVYLAHSIWNLVALLLITWIVPDRYCGPVMLLIRLSSILLSRSFGFREVNFLLHTDHLFLLMGSWLLPEF